MGTRNAMSDAKSIVMGVLSGLIKDDGTGITREQASQLASELEKIWGPPSKSLLRRLGTVREGLERALAQQEVLEKEILAAEKEIKRLQLENVCLRTSIES